MDNANTDEDITNVFKEKNKEIYTSVPTDDMELETISQDINSLVLTSRNNDSCFIYLLFILFESYTIAWQKT